MRYSIQQFRGVKSANFDVEKLTLIAGKNYHGKTSLAQACAFVLTGTTMPEGLAKKNIDRIIHTGSKHAQISISDGDGNGATIDYPEASYSTIGNGFHASKIAAGLESPVDYSKKELSGFLAKFMNTNPKFDDLRTAIVEAELTADELNELWQKISHNGWDAVHAKAKETCIERKGEWRHITGGENYGNQKAETWTPAGWTPGIENELIENIQKHIVTLNEEYLRSIRRTAVDDSEIERLKKLAGDIKTAQKDFNEKQKVSEKLGSLLSQLRLQSAPKVPSKEDVQRCPYCKLSLLIKDGKIIQAPQDNFVSEEKVEEAKEALEKYNAKFQQTEHDYNEAMAEEKKALAYLESCEKAKLDLSRIEEEKKKDKPARTAEEITAEIECLKARIKAIETYKEALSIHERIKKGEIIIGALAEDGVRKTVLEQALNGLNADLAMLCKKANWKHVWIDDEMNIFYGNFLYEFCSRSERYRAKAILQLYIAEHNKSDMVIFDEADMLDSQGRNEFFTLLTACDIPALVCMTMNEQKDIPDLSGIGGVSYWMEMGVLKCLEL